MQWLMKEETYFESNCGVCASFGELLLLIATHFHGNRIAAIRELVCSTLDMEIPLRRTSNTTRMKQIFTQYIFTEQIVIAHAVKVQVTPNLNANTSGYLPAHCIHQWMKSRAFSKHGVPIKSWIYKQICNSSAPLHPVLPLLVESYVESITVPNLNPPIKYTDEPLSIEDMLGVFNLDLDARKMTENGKENRETPNIISQLLLLYYLLLYEDARLSNMKNLLAAGRQSVTYPKEFTCELPVKYLLTQVQHNHREFTRLFGPLNYLLKRQFPNSILIEEKRQRVSNVNMNASTAPLDLNASSSNVSISLYIFYPYYIVHIYIFNKLQIGIFIRFYFRSVEIKK